MMISMYLLLTQILFMTSAVLCGIYFVFSNTVMPALARQTTAQGIDAMRKINQQIQNPVFFVLFFGSAMSSVAVLALAAIAPETLPPAIKLNWQTTLGACLVLFAFLSTVLVNVPLNNRLDAEQGASPSAAQTWEHYLDKWVRWNHLRTLSTLLGALLAMPVSPL